MVRRPVYPRADRTASPASSTPPAMTPAVSEIRASSSTHVTRACTAPMPSSFRTASAQPVAALSSATLRAKPVPTSTPSAFPTSPKVRPLPGWRPSASAASLPSRSSRLVSNQQEPRFRRGFCRGCRRHNALATCGPQHRIRFRGHASEDCGGLAELAIDRRAQRGAHRTQTPRRSTRAPASRRCPDR